MNNNLSLVVSKALPGMMTESLTYNPAKNVFLTQGWTSHAGNTYYRAVRGTNGIVIIFDNNSMLQKRDARTNVERVGQIVRGNNNGGFPLFTVSFQ